MDNAVPVAAVLLGLVASAPSAAMAQADATADSVMAPGQVFRDCTACPEMVVVPSGVFIMGSPESDEERLHIVLDEEGQVFHWTVGELILADGQQLQEGHRLVEPEGPQRYVTISAPFALGVSEVTFSEWDACARAGGCGGMIPDNEGWGRGSRPVVNVSWEDAQSPRP